MPRRGGGRPALTRLRLGNGLRLLGVGRCRSEAQSRPPCAWWAAAGGREAWAAARPGGSTYSGAASAGGTSASPPAGRPAADAPDGLRTRSPAGSGGASMVGRGPRRRRGRQAGRWVSARAACRAVDLSSLWGEVDQPQPVAFLRAVHVRRLVRQRFTALARSGPEIRHAAPHTRRCAGHPAENPTRLRLQDPVCGLQPRKDGFRVSFALRRWLTARESSRPSNTARDGGRTSSGFDRRPTSTTN